MKKFVFINIPSQELERPPAAAAAISACVRHVGWDCKVFDFNLYLNKNVDSDTWVALEQFWRCKSLELTPEINSKLQEVIDNFIVQIKEYNPDMIGISVFSRFSVIPAWVILQNIRPKTQAKIVIGGAGSYTLPSSLPGLENFDFTHKKTTFAALTKEVGIADHYIQGDGEIAIMELLQKHETIAGLDGIAPVQIKDLDNLPHPNYQDIEPQKYLYTHEPGIYITATRGCVRKCTFCSVPDIWPKFTARSATDVLREIKHNNKTHGVSLFQFTDSLLNGNMKVWRELNRQLIDAKKQDPSLANIKYIGQFICRTRMEQTESDWELMSKAGANLLVTGFESYSPHVRKHMGKNYSNADIEFHLKQSAYYGIRNVALMFVGYPVETLEDHEYNIEFLHKFQKYAKAGVIHMIRWGYTGMFSNPEKIEKPGEVKLTTDPDFIKKFKNLPQGIRGIALGFGWINELNPSLDLRERIRRRLELHELSVKLGWPQTRNREELQIIYNILHNLNSNSLDAEEFNKLDTLLDFH